VKAAYVKAPYQFEVREAPLRPITEDEILLKISACGVCGTDMTTAASEAKDWQPFGHEIAGVVEKAGGRVSTVKPGDSVVLESGTFCRFCDNCRNGRVDLCNSGPSYWLKGPMGFSQYMIAPKEIAVPFSGISPEAATLVEPLGVAIDMVKTADIALGDEVLVVGVGPIGLMAVALARMQGAARVYAASHSRSAHRIELARRFGAEEIILSDREDYGAHRFSRGGVDRVLVTAPPAALPAAMQAARVGGIIAFIGIEYGPGGTVRFDANAFHFKKLQLRASFAAPALYFPLALRLLEAGRIDGDSLISHRFSIQDIAKGFAQLRDQKDQAAKGVMVSS